MRRGKVPIEPIQKLSSRQVTFCKRRCGLFKKAYELAVLCDAQVAVITFSSSGKMYEFSSPSSSVKMILDHYAKTITSKTRSNDSQSLRISDGVEDHSLISLQNLECRDIRMLDKLEHQLCMRLGYVREVLDRKMLEQIEDLDHLKVVKSLQQRYVHLAEAGKDVAAT